MTETIDCLHLEIHKNSCRCGNKWESSYPILASETHGYLGGTPDPTQSFRLPVKSMAETDRHYDHCFRCVPLALGKSWIVDRNRILEETKAAQRLALAAKTEDLLA